MKSTVRIFLTLFVFYVILCASVYLGQRFLTFPGRTTSQEEIQQVLNDFDQRLSEIRFVSIKGDTLWGWKLEPKPKTVEYKSDVSNVMDSNFSPKNHLDIHTSQGIAIYMGGNADDVWEAVDMMSKMSVPVYALNYPSFGKSTGVPSEQSIMEGVKEFFGSLKVDTKTRIILVGRSLGTGVAIQLNHWLVKEMNWPQEQISLKLITPYNSLWKIGQSRYPFLPVRLLITSPFESEKYVREITNEVHVIYAGEDRVVPHEYTDSLLGHFKNRVRLDTLFDFDHNNLLESKELQTLLAQ